MDRDQQDRKGKHSTPSRRSTLCSFRALTRSSLRLAPQLSQTLVLRYQYIREAQGMGPGNLFTQRREIISNRKPLGKHKKLFSLGYTNVHRTTVQRREALSHHLKKQPGKAGWCDYSQVCGPKAGTRNELRPGRANTGERKRESRTQNENACSLSGSAGQTQGPWQCTAKIFHYPGKSSGSYLLI